MGKRRKPPAASADTLHDEVAQFASSLGLAGAPGDATFDDFAPSKARLRAGDDDDPAHPSDAPPPRRKSTNKFKPDVAPTRPPAAEAAKPEVDAAITERTWNEGVGRRPGGASSKSLLGNESSTLWHVAAQSLPPLSASGAPAADDDLIETKTKVAERLLEAEAAAFQKQMAKSNPADAQWLQTVRTSGTMRDKIAANALLVEEGAAANVRALDELLALVAKAAGAREVVGQAIEALKALFHDILLPDRRLVAFADRPFRAAKPSKENDKRLLLWWVEDCVKKRYAVFVDALARASTDNLEWVKDKALKAAYELLAAKPEQEAQLLTILTNKLGDPNRKVASKAGYLLSCLLTQHPLMGPVVVREVESFLFRPGQKSRARYYAVVTLNQMVLSHQEKRGGAGLAAKLIDIYFTLFRLTLEHKIGQAADRAEHAEAKAAAAPAARKGGRRAKPTKRGKVRGGGKHGRQAPRVEVAAEEVDARMLGALLTGVRRAYPYVAAGALDGVFAKHSTELFRTVHRAPFHVGTQALMLLFQVMTAQEAVSDRFYSALYQAMLHPSLAKSSALSQFLGLFLQAVKVDVSARRAAALLKRLLQVAAHQAPNVACAVLVVTSEVLKSKAALWPALTHAEDGGGAEARDVPDDDDALVLAVPPAGQDVPAWPPEDHYDMHKRAPQHARAERACVWELAPLAQHAHPSVSTMARTLLAGSNILYDGDPLSDLTLLAFLDKFVKKKPGKPADAKGASVMQPVRPEGGTAAAAADDDALSRSAVTSSAFAALAAEDIAPEDVFFHKYMTLDTVRRRAAANRSKRKATAKRKRRGGGDAEGLLPDDGSSGSDDDDDGAAAASDASDDSAAEDAFLEEAETMEGDALGDPAIGMDLADFSDASDDALSDVDAEPSDAGTGSDADADDARWRVSDADLEGVNIFDLPSGSGSSASDAGSDEGGAGSGDEGVALGDAVLGDVGGAADGDAASSDSSLDEAAFRRAILQDEGGSVDSDAGVAPVEEPAAPRLGKRQKATRKGSHGGGLFAAAEDYADVIEDAERSRGVGKERGTVLPERTAKRPRGALKQQQAAGKRRKR